MFNLGICFIFLRRIIILNKYTIFNISAPDEYFVLSNIIITHKYIKYQELVIIEI